jgi:hypothetical protein
MRQFRLAFAIVLVFALWTQFCWLPGRTDPRYLKNRGIVLVAVLAMLLVVAGWRRWRRK